jgi:hypothetical protein
VLCGTHSDLTPPYAFASLDRRIYVESQQARRGSAESDTTSYTRGRWPFAVDVSRTQEEEIDGEGQRTLNPR